MGTASNSRAGRRHFLRLALALTMMAPLLPSAMALTAEERAQIGEINRFLNSFHTLKGDFTQVSPRGRVSTGRVFIAKPGRMRFEYTPPHPLVIVSDGTWVAIRNNAKDKVDYYPLSKTPLKLVLAENVDLLRDANVQRVEKREGYVLVTLQAQDKGVPGSLLLVYDPAQKVLRQWTVIDPQGRRTTITLSQLERDVRLDARLFRVQRPGSGPKRRHVRQNFSARRQ
jgi:outer membrane lipoprotein-sorting protein